MQTAEQSKSEESAVTRPRQILTFCVGRETYGVDILRVQEIRGWVPVTRIPQTPERVLGVLNLRGSIVPIIDLRVQFGLDEAGFTALTVIVVLSVNSASGKREFGLVVDSVSDVVDLEAAHLKAAPELGGKSDERFIQGLATVNDRMLILLDVDEMIRVDFMQGEPAAASVAA